MIKIFERLLYVQDYEIQIMKAYYATHFFSQLFVKVTAIDMSCNLNRSATDVDSAAEESAEVELTQMRNLAMGSWPNVEVAVSKLT